jgi:site-specific DNA recombinase
VNISRFLEEQRISTRTGRPHWHRDQIKFMLKNETYTGVRHYNRMRHATEANREGNEVIRGKWIFRDRAEWIAVNVPAIVSRELFDKVQERLSTHDQRYCKPATHYLLSGLVQCGVCGARCSSSRRYYKVVLPSGKVSVYHRAIYRCNRQAEEQIHDRTRIERCGNSRIGTHILEDKVFEMICETMLDPAKLRGCIEGAAGLDDRSLAQELAKVARRIGVIDQERRQLIDRYAADQMTGDEYISANRALDEKLGRLVREKAKLAASLRSPRQEDFLDASVRQFCANAHARLQACTDFDDKRQFLVGHVERVIYNRYDITIVGSVPVQSASGDAKLPFRIEGKIDIKAVRSSAGRKAALEQLRVSSKAAAQPVLSLVSTYPEIAV